MSLPSAEEVRRNIEQGDTLYAQCFSTPDGKKVLKDLRERFVTRSSIVPGDPYMTYAKEGAREVVMYILKRMESSDERMAS